MIPDITLDELKAIAAAPGARIDKASRIAAVIRSSLASRWVGIYDIDARRGTATNIAWSGPGAPAHPVFPVSQGLTGRAVAERRTVNVGDVTQDPVYLTTFGSTRSEIILPVVDTVSEAVVGTIDVESEIPNAFDQAAQEFLENCALAIRSLWRVAGLADPLRRAWEWPAGEVRRVGYRTIDLIVEHLSALPGRPVFRPFPPDLAASYLASPPPEKGQSPDEILSIFKTEIEPFPFGNGHPRFFGWVNSPPEAIGIFADALAAAMNPSCAGGNHAAVYVERQVIDWFRQITGFPPESMGLLVSGASMAALTALAVARHAGCGFDVRTCGVQRSPSRLLVYKSGEGHGCHQKAVELLGIGSENLRMIESDRAHRMLPAALDAALGRDREQGNTPLAVVASAGTVNTGAIDPLDEIADICARHKVWLHVDGAYGAPAILTSKYRKELSAISRADSLALDPHKWLYVPVEAGLVLVRDAQAMRDAFSLVPPYLRTDGKLEGVGGLPWFSEYGFQQTRGFRALKVWMALRQHGIEGYRASIERDIALAENLADRIRATPDLELCEPQSLSIVCFRYAPPNLRDGAGALNSLNKDLLEKIQMGGRVFLSSTVMDGTFWMRACIVNPRTREEDVAEIMMAVRDACDCLSATGGA